MPGRLCGESRSGPETWKLGRRGDRKDGHAAGDNAQRGKHRAGHTTSPRFKVIRGCARRSNWSQTRRSGPGKRAAFDGAASGSGPGTFSLGGESNPVNPSQGARQRASEAGSRPSLSADNAGTRERCSEGSRSRARRAEQAELLGKPGNDRAVHAEAGSSPSSEAPLDHALRQGFGRAGSMEAAISGESPWRR